MLPAAVSQREKIRDEVREVEAALRPDIVRIRYNIGEDWADRWAIFFRIVLSDDAAKIACARWRTTWSRVSPSIWISTPLASIHTTTSEANPSRRRLGTKRGHRRWRMRTTC
jgi:hypothetical protein